MFYVTSLDGSQVEPLINIGTDFKMEQSVDGTFNVSFSCFDSDNNPGYKILRSESIVTVDGNDFKIKQYSDTAFSKTIIGTSIFFELSKVQRSGIFSGSHTLNNHLNFVFSGTGWNYQVDDAVANIANFIENLGNDNIISLIEKIVRYHQVEYIILPGKNVRFAKQVGSDNDFQYRYKHNVSDVVLTEDTTNLYTFIRGFGSDDLQVSYTSPNISIFGNLEAAPIRDDRFTNASALTNYIKSSIVDVPELAIESRIPELTSRETGERVWLIYEPLNIEMQTRILKQTKALINGELVTENVILGNTLIKSSIDILVEQKQEIEDTKDYVNDTNDNLSESQIEYRTRFDVTDRNIVLQVERIDQSIATIDIKADNINLSVNNRITNEVAAIDIRADQIQSSVSDLDTRTSSSITQLNNNINLKIDRGGAITDINLSPGQATINADRINLNGAVLANGSITGTSTINVGTDLYVGNNIYLAQGSSGSKSIIFDNVARIDGSFGNIVISAPNVRIESNVTIGDSSGTVNFGGNVNFQFASSISGVARANSSGIGISTSDGRLYVQVDGSTIGSVELT